MNISHYIILHNFFLTSQRHLDHYSSNEIDDKKEQTAVI